MVNHGIYIYGYTGFTMGINMKVNGKDYPIKKGKKNMFQTTKQYVNKGLS